MSESAALTDAELVQSLCDVGYGLTAWELQFVESIAERVLDENLPLTENQREKAREIWGRVSE